MSSQHIQSAYSWLAEHNFLLSKPLLEAIYLNIKVTNPYHKSIKDVDFLIDEENRKLLIFVELNLPWYFLNPRKKQKQFSYWILDSLEDFIPEFKVKVTYNKDQFYNLVKLIKGEPVGEEKK